MKRIILSAVMAAATLAAGSAMAQPYGVYGGYDRYDRYDGYDRYDRYDRRDYRRHRGHSSWRWRDSDRDGTPDRREWNRDRDRDGRPDQWDRTDSRRDRWRSDRSGWDWGW